MSYLELPRLGETMEEGELVAWLKQPGQQVRRGEAVAEIGTDKVVAELPALEDFVLEEHLVRPGERVRVGQPIARIRLGLDPERPRASPAARRLARALGVDLARLRGSGPRGRITTDDVRAAAAEPSAAPKDLQLLSRLQQATARITSASKREIPHFYVRVCAEVSALVRALGSGSGLSFNDALVAAVARALRRHPKLNAALEPEGLRLLSPIHIGVITSTPEGLVTSVVRDADRLSVDEIHRRVREVRARAVAGQARREDVEGATFCISNLGMFGVEEFSAIILPPNVAILAVGAVREEVVVRGETLRIARTVRLTVSADHRALGGVEVAEFLQTLCTLLAQPSEIGLPEGG